jgi:hypothetical protein
MKPSDVGFGDRNVSIANVTRAEASGDRSIRRMLIGRELFNDTK